MKIACEQCGKKFWQTDGHTPPRQRFCGKSCAALHSAEIRRNYNRVWMKKHRAIKPVVKEVKAAKAEPDRCPHCSILLSVKHDCLSPVKF